MTIEFFEHVASWPTPQNGWPDMAWTEEYRGESIPTGTPTSLGLGANCQRYAYSVLELFGLFVPPHRSSELWDDPQFAHPAVGAVRPLDLVLFNSNQNAWGAHVAVHMSTNELLHLCKEVGNPAVWSWDEFANRPRYKQIVGIVRPTENPAAPTGS